MSAPPRLVSEVLALPGPERAELAHKLLESLESSPDEELDGAWLTELDSRADAVHSGAVQPIPWEVAHESIVSELNKRRAARSTS